MQAQVSGTVFRDYNGNGTKDVDDLGVASVTVTAYFNATIATATSTTAGSYSFSAIQIPNATKVRLEFSGIPTGNFSGPLSAAAAGNGKYDAGTELGVANVTVKLLEVTSPVGASAVSTSLVSTTVTDGAGNYLFSNLPSGRYVVEFVKTSLPSTCAISPGFQKPGVPDALNSDADPNHGPLADHHDPTNGPHQTDHSDG